MFSSGSLETSADSPPYYWFATTRSKYKYTTSRQYYCVIFDDIHDTMISKLRAIECYIHIIFIPNSYSFSEWNTHISVWKIRYYSIRGHIRKFACHYDVYTPLMLPVLPHDMVLKTVKRSRYIIEEFYREFTAEAPVLHL